MGRVAVEAGSRLHAGFHTMRPDGIRGTAGFYAAKPRVLVEAEDCGEPGVEAPEAYRGLLEGVLGKLGVSACLRLVEAPPRHVGLGSTTQVSLAAAQAALAAARGDPGDPLELARLLGRGRVSGAGTLLYVHGGFVADAGVPDPEGPRPLVALRIPLEWRLVILLPRLPPGPSEEEEREGLIPRMAPGAMNVEMARGLLDLAMGVARGNLGQALEGLWRMQVATGAAFMRVQKGLFRKDLNMIVEEARRSGLTVAQSSWGPTLYTITTVEEAPSTARLLESIAREYGVSAEAIVSEPRNSGATLRVAGGGG